MLNIVQTQGNFDPYVKYNAKAGRWYTKNESGEEIEIQNPVFVADFDNIKTGWLLFMEGQGPSKVWDADLRTPAPKPDDKHKRGFSLRCFSKTSFGGVAELSSSSMHLCASINDLYVAYEADKAKNAGKLPVVKYTGATPMKDKMGTNYKPNFVIDKWVARPVEFDEGGEKAAPVAPPPAPVVQQSSVSEF